MHRNILETYGFSDTSPSNIDEHGIRARLRDLLGTLQLEFQVPPGPKARAVRAVWQGTFTREQFMACDECVQQRIAELRRTASRIREGGSTLDLQGEQILREQASFAERQYAELRSAIYEIMGEATPVVQTLMELNSEERKKENAS